MANRHRGEIDAVLDGVRYRLCLTLGALAELEAAFGDEDMLALASRFEKGRLRAQDCVRIIAAGLRGGGTEVSDADVSRMRNERGAAGFVAIVAELLEATFGAPEHKGVAPAASLPATPPGEVRSSPTPFHGLT